MRFEVVYSLWGAEVAADKSEAFDGGEHEIAKPSKHLMRCLAGAEATGHVRILDCTAAERKELDAHVQPQGAGESAWENAVQAGHEAREKQLARHRKEAAKDMPPEVAGSGEDAELGWLHSEAMRRLNEDDSWAEGTWHEGALAQFRLDEAAAAPIAVLDGKKG